MCVCVCGGGGEIMDWYEVNFEGVVFTYQPFIQIFLLKFSRFIFFCL